MQVSWVGQVPNPKGIATSSPRLSRETGSNLGLEVARGHNLNEVVAGVNWPDYSQAIDKGRLATATTRFGVVTGFSTRVSQGGFPLRGTTLGFMLQSRWDWSPRVRPCSGF